MTQTLEHSTALAHSGNGAGMGFVPRANPTVGQRGIVVNTIDELWRLSQAFAKSGLAPKGISSPEAIFTAVQLGLELGLSPMSALQSIAVVNGRPSIYGDAALALVRGSGICDFYTEFPSNDEIHSLAEQLAIALEYNEIDEVKRLRREIASKSTKMRRDAEDFGYTSISKRAGGINAVIRRFTIGDAKKAQLLGKSGPWVQYQERMLMWRSRGFNL
ncbi:MAG TPA: hypothetical protein VFW23_13995, partial [Tepidisphaeraceae bacterium]|nr:hypothetical protein [Tepidisphaeraceae bacterium]